VSLFDHMKLVTCLIPSYIVGKVEFMSAGGCPVKVWSLNRHLAIPVLDWLWLVP